MPGDEGTYSVLGLRILAYVLTRSDFPDSASSLVNLMRYRMR